jgi:branched-chain amino acid transport system permease protein
MKSAFNVRNAVVALVIAGLMLLPLYSALSGKIFILTLFTRIIIFALAAASLNLIMGYGGMMSFGHAAYLGIGGYAVGILAQEGVGSALVQWPVALAASALFALAVGALSLRTRGIYFIMVTLAFGEMLFYLFRDTKFAGGSDGAFINLKPEAVLFGITIIDLEKARVFYWAVLALALFTILLLHFITRAPFGAALAAARDNERRARSLGFPIYRLRLTAFVISGALAGLAGYFAAAQFGYVAPQMLGWHQSAIALVMVVLGGQRGIAGPLLGAAIVMGLEEWLKALTEHWKLVEGLIIIAIVLAFPGGLQALIDRVLPAHDLEASEPGSGQDHAQMRKEPDHG